MNGQGSIAVIGAGVVGSAVAYALAREGRRVTLIDRADPGVAGASFGNAGHIAAELVEPLPSPQLLFGFWRELFSNGGPLDIPVARWGPFSPWALRFAAAAFRRAANTQHLLPLVKPSATLFEHWLREIGHPSLLRRNGHYEIWLDVQAVRRRNAQAQKMKALGIYTLLAPTELLDAASSSAANVAGLWFPDSAHVVDPLEFVRVLVAAAVGCGAIVEHAEVHSLRALGDGIELVTDQGTIQAAAVVICAGAWSARLLASFGLHAPIEAANGYHVELPAQPPLVDAPILYSNERIVVTPMSGRIRCTGYMEFSGIDSPHDLRKPSHLRAVVRSLGYSCDDEGASWRGPRPVLPDYLPGIGRAPGPTPLFYAVGHQHIGLTIAPITAELIADLVAQRKPRLDISAFDLKRFGAARSP